MTPNTVQMNMHMDILSNKSSSSVYWFHETKPSVDEKCIT
jgi:hypothetical protein